MDRDSFIIQVYCLVAKICQTVTAQQKIRRGGFPPALTDAEVITMEICGSYFKLHTDKDMFEYFASRNLHFFPALCDRPAFVRQAANLWHVKVQITDTAPPRRWIITASSWVCEFPKPE